jgi:hypothetical protein
MLQYFSKKKTHDNYNIIPKLYSITKKMIMLCIYNFKELHDPTPVCFYKFSDIFVWRKSKVDVMMMCKCKHVYSYNLQFTTFVFLLSQNTKVVSSHEFAPPSYIMHTRSSYLKKAGSGPNASKMYA